MAEQHGHTPHEQADAARALAARRGRHGALLPAALSRARAGTPADPGQWAPQVGRALGLPAAAGLGPATYFADLAAPHGERHVRVCTATACFATQGGRHVGEVEHELGVSANEADPDGGTSLQTVHCLGYCYAGPAALDGTGPRTGTDLAGQLGGRTPPRAPAVPVADATGDPVLLSGIVAGRPSWDTWQRTFALLSPEDVRREVAASGLRGRGGGGGAGGGRGAARGGRPPTRGGARSVEGAARG
ncbi:NADH-quinone oxidoreductase subunit NuoE family protein, partial [Streptomyces clavifer]|uniref:NADH-quinone oxidoreductase subunit NuoE family protein n=1 Tax=Streptomyces clavifer TaxID=68188 RepID=UPI003662C680